MTTKTKDLGRARAAHARVTYEFRVRRFMLGASMDRLHAALNSPKQDLRLIREAALAVHSDTGALYGDAYWVAETRGFVARAKAGKPRGSGPVWPSMTQILNGPGARRRRKHAEKLVEWEDANP